MKPRACARRLNFDRSPAVLEFWHLELQEYEDDFMTDEEIESAFLSWWAPYLHWLWTGGDGVEAIRQADAGEVWR